MDKDLFLEHIAKTTGIEIDFVVNSLCLEYWKNRCEFLTINSRGIFVEYLRAKRVTELKRFPMDFGIDIPETDFDPKAPSRNTVRLCIGDMNEKTRVYKLK